MEKSQKKVFVEKIKKTLDDVGILVITHYSGLKTSETDELRLKLREVGGSLQITKNSLMQIALKDNKNKELKSLFNGPIAIAYSKDEISAAKVAVNFSKEHDKLIILGGLAGNKFLEQNDVLDQDSKEDDMVSFIKKSNQSDPQSETKSEPVSSPFEAFEKVETLTW